MWYRVFSPLRTEPSPVELVERLHSQGYAIVPHFKGDDHGWTSAELILPAGGTPIMVARYLTKEDQLRGDLNAYAAELETMTFSPNAPMLMEKVIQTQQLLTLRKPIDAGSDAQAESVCELLCQDLARTLDGLYQIDGQGWFAASGEKLLQEY
jgi:hypothetical protein